MRGVNIKKAFALVLVMVIIVGILGACAPDADSDYTDLSVRDYIGTNGIVTAANPYAAKVGLDVLKKGGNAFDAAVAVSFAIGVAEVDANGLGGGGLMIAYNVKTGKSLYYNFREFAAAGVNMDMSQYSNITTSNCCIETAVPTQVAGLLSILEEQGTLTRQEAMQPAIDLARNGVVVTPELAKNISGYLDLIELRNGVDVSNTFKLDGLEALGVGNKLVQSDLAKSLEYVALNGAEGFYTGEIARKIVDAANAHGGSLTMEDMKYAYDNYPIKADALKGTYKGYDILTVGSPSTGGTMLLEMLNMLESCGDISSLGHNKAEYINLLATVMQLAYGDKEKYMADSAVVDVPTKGLISKEYAAKRIEKYKVGKAYLGAGQGDEPYGDPMPYNDVVVPTYAYGESGEHSSTTSFSIIDKDGNIVTFTQTINNFFGSGIVPKDCGFFLNNELKDFTYKEGSINAIAPHKQSASYMAPTVILKDAKPYATLGSPGGSKIPAALLQVILNMIEFDMNMQQAINAARAYCFTTAQGEKNTAKTIEIEDALSSLTDTLTSYGYKVIIKKSGSFAYNSYFGGVQGIRVEKEGYHGGADPRRDGKALGY